MKNNFSIPAFAWLLLASICVILILIGLNASLKKTGWEKTRQRKIFSGVALAIVLWTALILLLSYKGFLANFSKMPPRPALVMLIPLPVIILIAFSKTGIQILRSVPSHWLIWMQSFRIVVELLLLFAFISGKIPVQMTFEGRNFDVLTGVLALPVGYLLAKKKRYASKLAIVFNITGMLLLLNILVIAILSMPTPFRYFMNEPSNTLVAQFPFILLPAVLVPIAYAMHIFSLRQLFAEQSRLMMS
jgi:hypothetical protein